MERDYDKRLRVTPYVKPKGLSWYSIRRWVGSVRAIKNRRDDLKRLKGANAKLRFLGSVEFYFTNKDGDKTQNYFADFYLSNDGGRDLKIRSQSGGDGYLAHSIWTCMLKFKSGAHDEHYWRSFIKQLEKQNS